MTRKLFGTDGIRGRANAEPVTAATALRLALGAGAEFTRGDHRHRVVIGKDTRLSGYMLEPALTAGFISMGMDVILLGPLPTPAVAMLTRSLRADLGVMISASHNPFEDNGIKLFGPDGYKLSDAAEARIEAKMAEADLLPLVASPALGRAQRLEDARGRYTEYVKRSFPKDLSLAGLKIVIDCAHGSAYRVAPTVLWELGAEVVPIGVAPDGTNINQDCGAVSPALLQRTVVAERAHLGIALDGDADRLILVDEHGQIIDGDQMMALVAASWKASGRLAGDGIVATVMSNLGLERHLQSLGLVLHRVAVGDRYVVEKMRADGFNVGGEQSGHIILSDYGTTGDGLVAALQVLAVIVRAGKPASESGRPFKPYPQLLKNLRYGGGQPLEAQAVKTAIREAEAALGKTGRLLVRKSGTEPVIRVMAEAEDEKLVRRMVEAVSAAIEHEAPAAMPAGSEAVLAVEDDPQLRSFTEQALTSLGYRVVTAADGPSALACLERDPAIDLLFTDIVIPGGMNGRQLAEEARRRRPRIAVLFTSGYADNAIAQQSGSDVGADLLDKPYRQADLAAKIRRALDSRQASHDR